MEWLYSILHTREPFHYHRLTLIQVWIGNYMHHKAWNKITYPFPNFNSAAVEIQDWISNFTRTLLSMWLVINVVIDVNPY